jgi:5-methylcytosine-specific restriction protein A
MAAPVLAKRETAAKRGYGYRWQKYSAARLLRHPLCVDPDKRHKDVYVAAALTDHIVPVSGPEDSKFWESDNHQSLCWSCHSYKTAKEDGGFGHKGNRINAWGRGV